MVVRHARVEDLGDVVQVLALAHREGRVVVPGHLAAASAEKLKEKITS